MSSSTHRIKCANIVFAEKIWGAFGVQNVQSVRYVWNFNVSFTKDVVSFE